MNCHQWLLIFWLLVTIYVFLDIKYEQNLKHLARDVSEIWLI